MISKCYVIRKTNRYVVSTLLLICNLFTCVSAANTIAECGIVFGASTAGTFAVCTIISLALILYLRRRFKHGISQVSKRDVVTDEGSLEETLHFQNKSAISQDSDTPHGCIKTATNDALSTKVGNPDNPVLSKLKLVDCSTQTNGHDFAKHKEQIVLEKRQDGSFGLNLSVAGLFVLNICDDLSIKSGCCIEPGDEVLSINGVEVEGMSDMEAHALLAKSGPIAHLAIVKNAFLWRVQHLNEQQKQQDVKKPQKICTTPMCVEKEAALKRAKIEMDEALMELRRSTSASCKESQQCISRHRENSSPYQSLTSSVEVQEPIAEEEFVVIESSEIAGSSKSAQRAKENHVLLTPQINVHDIDNSSTRSSRSKGLIGSGHSNQDNKVIQARVNGEVDDIILTQSIPSEVENAKFDVDASKSLPVSLQEQQSMRQGLSLPLSSVSIVPKISSTTDDRTSCVTFASLRTASTPTKAVEMIESSSSPSSSVYYIPYDGKVPQFTQSFYDMDKINPPPSYQVASQIFNSQKPGVRGESTEQKMNVANLMNGYSSQGSSFDEIESLFPSTLPKTGRESLGIDDHVIRYMTKKYSEPRLQTVSPRNGMTASIINGSRSIPQGIRTPAYVGSSPSITERPFIAQSRVKTNHSGEIEPIDNTPGSTSLPAPQPMASVLNHTLWQNSAPTTNRSKGCSPKNDEHPIASGQPSIEDAQGVAVVQIRKKGSDQSSRLHVDHDKEMLGINAVEGPSVSPRITPGSLQRKAVSSSRLAKCHKQRIINDNSSERMRRATSSPSVNSEHQQNGCVELEVDITSETNQAHGNRNNRKIRDDFSDRRKSIDSGSLRKLAAELQANQNLCDDFPMLSKLLGGAGLQDLEPSADLPRYRSSDTLYKQF